MGFKFSFLCDLLSDLEANRIVKASTAARSRDPDIRTIISWFNLHRRRIHAKDTNLLALLSCFFPEKRTDRVYWLQDASLAKVVGRCLLLGISRKGELDNWRVSRGDDLGQCVENVMRQAENYIPNDQEITLEDIDAAMDKLASRCRFSGPRLRRQYTAVDVEETLGTLYRRVSSRDAKWLTRLILKSYYPVMLPVKFILQQIHFLLPHLLLFQDSFEAAVGMLKTSPLNCFQPCPEPGVAKLLCENAVQYFIPRIGIKVGRPDFYKARGVKHCYQMVGQRRMSVERKYDGEYCQIHIDLSKQPNPIQIFSKSGKDSTIDRSVVHKAIKQCLRIGEQDCRLSQHCILEGELLVWSDKEERILEFHKLRKYISRSGTFIGTDNDSQPRPYEHLMIIFFDVLLHDDNICLAWPHRERRLLLKKIIEPVPGQTGISEQEIIDFSRNDSRSHLERAFAKSIAERWEGFVLKCCDEPYFPILSPGMNPIFGRWIKLKKDYIPGLGDTVDLALIGGRYNSRDATALKGMDGLLWTSFHVGCLENKNAVSQFNATPKFRVIDVIDRYCLSQKLMGLLNSLGRFRACEPDSNSAFIVQKGHEGLPDMDAAFRVPFVVEMLGSGFDKPSNSSYFTLRFPRVLKIHNDRTFEATVSFAEIQQLADKARSIPTHELSQEIITWKKQLEHRNGKSEYIIDRSQETTVSRCSTPSVASISPSSRQTSSTDPSVSRQSIVTFIPSTSPLLHQIQRQNIYSSTRPSATKRSLPCDFQDGACEGHRRKKSRGDHAFKENIAIFTDNPQSSSQTHQMSLLNCPLTSISNIQPPKENIEAESPDSIERLFTQDENSTLRQLGIQESCDKKKVKQNRSMVPAQYTNTMSSAVQRTETAQAVHNPDKNVPVLIYLRSPFTTIPIYIGQSFSRGSAKKKRLLGIQGRKFSTDSCHFIEELCSLETRKELSESNPSTIVAEIALGIVLIDTKHPHELLEDVTTVSDELARCILRNRQSLPSQGKLYLLDWRVMRQVSDIDNCRFCLKETWIKIAIDHFHSCIAWGFKSNSKGKETLRGETRSSKEEKSVLTWEPDDTSREYNTISTGVRIVWDPAILQALGEFLCIDPLVHVSGQLYVNTRRSV